ncbi:MAG TPA: alpha-galactosidase [Candidatus Hydrogenedentes bacterium]|nr:alpha-galactosidase [Candidatus Hydrogenedentota bacterium]
MSFQTACCYVTHDAEKGLIAIGNARIERVFQYDLNEGKFFTSAFTEKCTGTNWAVNAFHEFRLVLENGKGRVCVANRHSDTQAGLQFEGYSVEDLGDGGKRLRVDLRSVGAPVRVYVYQEIHPGCDWLRRWLAVENAGDTVLVVTQYDPEMMGAPWGLRAFYFNSWRWGSKSFVPDEGTRGGMGIHSVDVSDRIVAPSTVGTDSPLVLTDGQEKAFLWFLPEVPIKGATVCGVGEPWLGTENVWDRTVEPGETVEFSAGAVMGVGAGDRRAGFHSFRKYLEEWVVRDNMGHEKAALVFNSWYGLGYSDVEPCEASCLKQIDACGDVGFEMYVLDAGWHGHFGDWDVDEKRFPRGLKVVADYCHEHGLKFGLWIDSRIACTCSRTHIEHEEWRVLQADGSHYPGGFGGHGLAVMCLGSDYGQHLKETYVRLASDLELDCLKIDNVCPMSFYSFWTECHAKDHHHAPGRSHGLVWERWAAILDAVRAARPGLIIESIPSGLSLLDKHHIVWGADYQYRPDWLREAYFCRALCYHMAYVQPISTIHVGWPSTECRDLHELDYLCASTIGAGIQCGATGRIESATQAQLGLLKEWIVWRRANKKYLGVYQHLFEDTPPIPLETATDDVAAKPLAYHWQPTYVDGFAHLLSDGGWVFLFNPANETKSVSFSLCLDDYGIDAFSAITEFDAFRFCSESNRLELRQTLAPMSYSRSWVQVGCPARIETIESRVLAVEWNATAKEFSFSTMGKSGACTATLMVGELGRPATFENCVERAYDVDTGTLEMAYGFPGGMAGGTQGPLEIRLRWDT